LPEWQIGDPGHWRERHRGIEVEGMLRIAQNA